MKSINAGKFKLRNPLKSFLFFSLIFFGANAARILAHGGEDHGDAQPKAATTAKGIVSRSARLGELEITFKTPVLEPDAGSAAKLFITKYETNEAVAGAVPTMEIESSGGTITQVAVEKTDVAGSYNLKIPALAEGNYTIRTSLKSTKGSDTATFSNVEVSHSAAAETADGGTGSWLRTILLFIAGATVLTLFGGLFYFAWRMATGEKRIGGETVSA